MPARSSTSDRTSTFVIIALVGLALLGVATVFHEPIAALLAPVTGGDRPVGTDDGDRI